MRSGLNLCVWRKIELPSAKARKIQELREARGMSADELSHRMGVDVATVRRWETGEEEVDDGALAQLADTLGASQDALRHDGDEEHHPER
jgi:transcriptional regulator with XRE-family HTH domain